MYTLASPVAKLPKVGPKTAALLKKMGIASVADVLFHFPSRYDDFCTVKRVADIHAGDTAVLCARIEVIATKRTPRKHMYITEALVADDTGSIKVIWFNQQFLGKQLFAGDRIWIAGTVERDYLGVYVTNPFVQKAASDADLTRNPFGLLAVYPLAGTLTQRAMRTIVKHAMAEINHLHDWLPGSIIEEQKIAGLAQALTLLHLPRTGEDIARALERLKFDELFTVVLQSHLIRQEIRSSHSPVMAFDEEKTKSFIASLPFTLTADQKRAAWQIIQDMEKAEGGNRLVIGDVGTGKTIVAAIALHMAVYNGFQGAFMAPTGILAAQHAQTLAGLYAGKVPGIGLLTNERVDYDGVPVKKAELLTRIADGTCRAVIGTHALIQEGVRFANLGLIVVDEQHRFGVNQRKALKSMNASGVRPHFLSMTATPIPRSFALLFFGELDVSLLREFPAGKKLVQTNIMTDDKRGELYSFLRERIAEREQIFVVCPLIDASDTAGYSSVTAEWKRLIDDRLCDPSRIGLLHGRLKAGDKKAVMEKFANGDLDILVSTTVIEVGIDMPNATVMVIEGAERFGLAQLHQLRGRVGRRGQQAHCILIPGATGSDEPHRLQAIAATHDGFALAEYDLRFRGPGKVFGLQQSGFPEFKLASIHDTALIARAREAVSSFLNNYRLTDFPLLEQRMKRMTGTDHME